MLDELNDFILIDREIGGAVGSGLEKGKFTYEPLIRDMIIRGQVDVLEEQK